MTELRQCGRCHTCGGPIRKVLDGEEWCDRCARYQRPASHGWARDIGLSTDSTPCVAPPSHPVPMWLGACTRCGYLVHRDERHVLAAGGLLVEHEHCLLPPAYVPNTATPLLLIGEGD